MTFVRRTLRADAIFEGLGLHSGVPVTAAVRPGERGIVFRYGSASWSAHPANVTDTSRCTRLGEISTVEHLMSALCGLEITDADIELSAPEMPALDGGAGTFARGLRETGFADLPNIEFPELYSRVFVQEPDAKMAISVGSGHWRYEFQTGDRWPGEQIYETDNVIADYPEQIAPARTFCFDYELPMIKQAGLAQGLDEHSAVVLGPEGYLNETLFPDEPARHKLLDAMGDLYLSGIPARFLNVVAERTGHRANVKAAQLLAEAIGRPA